MKLQKKAFYFVLCLSGFEGEKTFTDSSSSQIAFKMIAAKTFTDSSKFSDCIQNDCNKIVYSMWIDIYLLKYSTALKYILKKKCHNVFNYN